VKNLPRRFVVITKATSMCEVFEERKSVAAFEFDPRVGLTLQDVEVIRTMVYREKA